MCTKKIAPANTHVDEFSTGTGTSGCKTDILPQHYLFYYKNNTYLMAQEMHHSLRAKILVSGCPIDCCTLTLVKNSSKPKKPLSRDWPKITNTQRMEMGTRPTHIVEKLVLGLTTDVGQ
jgi:hypothetical protein